MKQCCFIACKHDVYTGDLLFDPREARDRSYSRDEDHLALMMELLGPMPVSMTVRGRHTPRFFEREGRYLKRIKQLNYWPLNHVLVEKYDMDPQEVRLSFRCLQALRYCFYSYIDAVSGNCIGIHRSHRCVRVCAPVVS